LAAPKSLSDRLLHTLIMLRSKSTPALPACPKVLFKSQSSGDLDEMPRRRPQAAAALPASLHIAHTPRIEREDPFNLGGFFSATDNHDGDWTWLREEERQSGLPAYSQETVGEEAEGYIQVSNVLQREDKLGVLSLRELYGPLALLSAKSQVDFNDLMVKALMDSKSRSDDASFLSPYIVDEAVDHESLYGLHSKRRLATTTPQDRQLQLSASILFGPESREDLDQSPLPAWVSMLCKAIGLV
jgi:hypothetical protein